MSATIASASLTPAPGQRPTFEVFFDGDCPVCRREIVLLQRLDRRGAIRFTDIATTAFDPRAVGVSRPALMARIHGRDIGSGELVVGVEVFRRLYAAVGFGPIVALTRLAPLAWVLDRAYGWFARHRLRLTGRACSPETCGVVTE